MTESIVTKEQVLVGVDCLTKDEALRLIAQTAVDQGIGVDADMVYSAFLEREKLGPTGMEDGLAIPHAKSDGILRPAVCLAKFDKPIAWESLDGNPVTVAVALFVPTGEAGTTHVRLLSKVAVLASREGFSDFIGGCNDPKEIADYLRRGIGEM